VASKRCPKISPSLLGELGAIILLCFIISQIEIVYKDKGWYGPNFSHLRVHKWTAQ
jgi:hypothetical protein